MPRYPDRVRVSLQIVLTVLVGAALVVDSQAQEVNRSSPVEREEDVPDWEHDIRPILERSCFECHGASQQRAGLRLDQRAAALAGSDFGEFPVMVAGDRDASALLELVTLDDPDSRMPPGDDRTPLTMVEVETLGRWIDAGMPWPEDGEAASWPSQHWAYSAPRHPRVPDIPSNLEGWVRNEVDRFLVDAMVPKGLRPSPQAERSVLLRRASIDLTGLPPSEDAIDEFVADQSPGAWQRALEKLLGSRHYAEQQTRFWLDLARYADSNGYEKDDDRSMWPWRDWVIRAYADDMPFDRFTIEQFAGDLLPNASLEQRLATGFHRNTMTNLEGGTDPEEFRVAAVVDRVNVTGEVWLGATMGCVQCHDHKYDPYTQRDYYRLFAALNTTADSGGRNEPSLEVFTPEQLELIASLNAEVDLLQRVLNDEGEESIARRMAWAKSAQDLLATPERGDDGRGSAVWLEDLPPAGSKREGHWRPTPCGEDGGPETPRSGERAFRLEAQGFRQFFFAGARAPLRIAEGDAFFVNVWIDPKRPPRELLLQFRRPNGDWEHRAFLGEDLQPFGESGTASRLSLGGLPDTGEWIQLVVGAAAVGFSPGDLVDGFAFGQFDGRVWWDRAGIVSADSQVLAGLPDEVAEDLRGWPGDGASLPDSVTEWYRVGSRATEPQRVRMAELEAKRPKPPTSLVLEEMSDPRKTFVLERGSHLSPGVPVEPGVPAVLDGESRSPIGSRLDLAEWLVDPSNPVVARVTVNRIWKQVFGFGLVRTTDDFGTQGERPTHPELLDWLAHEFVARDWSVKEMYRLLLDSAAYRQSSVRRSEAAEVDPEDRLLSWFPRRRLDAEEIRDQALSLAGLLELTVGGPPVYPPQPVGIDNATYAGDRWRTSTGSDRYRRAIYTFWRRTSPYPSLILFDAPSRELSCARRDRSNTPLQALALLNEETYVAAAEAFGVRLSERGLAWGFRRCTGREADADELEVLQALRASDGCTAVAQVLLNLDETLTRG
ncbi:MAG: PSD1 and planctomycete cytochrome C domain-containing protein [Planctomycetota bacterium]